MVNSDGAATAVGAGDVRNGDVKVSTEPQARFESEDAENGEKSKNIEPKVEERVELKFSISSESYMKMQRLKGLLAHAKGELSLEGFFDHVLEIATEQSERKRGLKVSSSSLENRKPTTAPKVKESDSESASRKVSDKKNLDRKFLNKKSLEEKNGIVKKEENKNGKKLCNKRRVAVPAKIKREVLKVSKGACENCGSSYAVEIDHSRPVGKGGANARENLRTLCRSCNQRAAIVEYGEVKMNRYLKSPVALYRVRR